MQLARMKMKIGNSKLKKHILVKAPSFVIKGVGYHKNIGNSCKLFQNREVKWFNLYLIHTKRKHVWEFFNFQEVSNSMLIKKWTRLVIYHIFQKFGLVPRGIYRLSVSWGRRYFERDSYFNCIYLYLRCRFYFIVTINEDLINKQSFSLAGLGLLLCGVQGSVYALLMCKRSTALQRELQCLLCG